MRIGRRAGVIAGVLLLLSGCHTTESAKAPAREFVAAANTLLKAESEYMDDIQQASDASYRMGAAERYVAHGEEWKAIASSLRQRDDFSKAKELRVKVLEELVHYAQMVAVISKDGDTAWLDSSAKDTADAIAGILEDGELAHVTDEQKGALESVVSVFGHSIIDNAAADKLQYLAQRAEAPIAGIRRMVEEDDDAIERNLFASGLEKDQESSRKNILHYIYEDERVNAGQRLDAFLSVQDMHVVAVAKRRNIVEALKKLEAANHAIAEGASLVTGAILAQQAIAYGQMAVRVRKAMQPE